MNIIDSHFESLHRRIERTSAARFIASKRLIWHQRLSLWFISIISVGQIIIPLLEVYEFQLNYDDRFIGFIQVALSITALVYSLVLAINSNSDKHQKMHSCALELNDLARQMEPFASSGGSYKEYLYFAKQYDDILKRYDNNEQIDYLLMKLRYPHAYQINWLKRIAIYSRYLAGYSHYVLFTLVEIIIIYLMVS